MKTILVLLTACVAACSGAGDQDAAAPADTLTRAQRDSIVGASSLPGAGGVRRAIGVRDSANARGAAMDSLLGH
jgi:hypothetical protein